MSNTSRMKIAIIGSRGYPYVYSGYETFVSELSVRLVERGHEVYVYCHSQFFDAKPEAVNGVHLVYVPAIEKKIFSQFSHSFLSTLHVLTKDMDVVLYVNSANGPFGLFTRLFGKRTAINVDGLEWLRPKWKGLGAKYFYFASYLSTKFFDVVISDSDRMAEIYRKEFNSHSVTIAYGANIGYSTHPDLIAHLDLSPKDYYLIVGRLVPDNNANIIVKGFEKCGSKRKLVIVGDVPYRDSYAETIRRTKDSRIMFPGYVKDANVLRELYCNAYAYIHGHEFGGTNPSLLKALAYGNCILALDTVFNKEVLKDNEYGLFFEKNAESISRIIQSVDADENLANSFRSKARQRITENYTWEKITDQYNNLFIQMCPHSRQLL